MPELRLQAASYLRCPACCFGWFAGGNGASSAFADQRLGLTQQDSDHKRSVSRGTLLLVSRVVRLLGGRLLTLDVCLFFAGSIDAPQTQVKDWTFGLLPSSDHLNAPAAVEAGPDARHRLDLATRHVFIHRRSISHESDSVAMVAAVSCHRPE